VYPTLQQPSAGCWSSRSYEADSLCCAAQWGPVEYHEQSLKNLGVAMQRTKRLCAIIVDTIGREIMINRPYSLDEVRGATAVH